MAVEQWHIDHIFIDLRGRDFRGLNREIVSRRGASLDPGTDISLNIKSWYGSSEVTPVNIKNRSTTICQPSLRYSTKAEDHAGSSIRQTTAWPWPHYWIPPRKNDCLHILSIPSFRSLLTKFSSMVEVLGGARDIATTKLKIWSLTRLYITRIFIPKWRISTGHVTMVLLASKHCNILLSLQDQERSASHLIRN